MSEYQISSSPIADLTYRGYEGDLESPTMRWWVIARMTFRMAIKKKWMWFLLILSAGYYLAMMTILFFAEQAATSQAPVTGAAGAANPFTQFITQIIWKDQFVHGLSTGQMWFLMIAVLVGAGSIANDNRANALLVYLSKPCDKRDYLLGKWFGVFLLLVMCMAVPSAVFYGYGFMSYRDYGFLSDVWVPLKMAAFVIVSAAFYSSLVIGISSLFKQGRIAGATMAGLYFLTNFFTQLMAVSWAITIMQQNRGRNDAQATITGPLEIIGRLYYASVDGINIGLGKAILGTDGSPYFGFRSPVPSVPAPNLWIMLGIVSVLSAIFLRIAWSRIRAVEVVG
ncbi:MAG: ABC transporter permease subunit [Fimbriimonadaceae bacterium]|nr:ABC transporter permease subunit [Fimbriimonadaceae bacterium]